MSCARRFALDNLIQLGAAGLDICWVHLDATGLEGHEVKTETALKPWSIMPSCEAQSKAVRCQHWQRLRDSSLAVQVNWTAQIQGPTTAPGKGPLQQELLLG